MADLSLDPGWVDRADGPPLFVVAGQCEQQAFGQHMHQHARGQLFGSLRGLLSVGTETERWVVPAIHAVWLPPHHRHWARSHGPFHGWSAFIAEAACRDLPARPCLLAVSGLLREAVLRAGTWPLALPRKAQAHLVEVILDEIRASPAQSLGLPLPAERRLLRVAQALIDDPGDGRELGHWARWAALSPRTLSRRFVSETGFTFTAWRQRARLLRSLELLAAGRPVTAIALDLGYASAPSFITAFRQALGQTPAAYRQRLHGR
ncbi:helix-turn-helix transcriptional regulator [Stenotrophomonas sp. 24(2023)]|uniref:AraC family transcriptional regulator n=1 Tax=Stenotrophomonas sp. 24(2023) TaxID=3068324 RepID=UPI0027E0BADE|nr:helix-turn-helix transcriptional regulator [Stenotrophomonas sp. 24(2023)]WMJ68955.1 helix-turn-helix transcriptional regulator [Stenotrophomonas sp. 24(2023)]